MNKTIDFSEYKKRKKRIKRAHSTKGLFNSVFFWIALFIAAVMVVFLFQLYNSSTSENPSDIQRTVSSLTQALK